MAFLTKSVNILLDPRSPDESTAEHEAKRGCVVDVRFWYEEFMPRLLAVCSIDADGFTERDAIEATASAEGEARVLDKWFQEETKARLFGVFGRDMVVAWPRCSADLKMRLKRSWRLVRHYFHGPQKQREKSVGEGGNTVDHRNTGDLSQASYQLLDNRV